MQQQNISLCKLTLHRLVCAFHEYCCTLPNSICGRTRHASGTASGLLIKDIDDAVPQNGIIKVLRPLCRHTKQLHKCATQGKYHNSNAVWSIKKSIQKITRMKYNHAAASR
jgi:hypothetical protein